MAGNTTIQIKRSGDVGNTPNTSIINYGELALNYADGLLFYKNSLGQIKSIKTQDVFESINIGGSLLVPTSPSDVLTINSANGIVLSACTTTDTIIIGENLSPLINISLSQANAAYDQANAAFNAANASSPEFANAAFAQANIANATAQAGFNQANTANTLAQSAFDKANTANTTAQAGFNQANTANVTAQAAFNAANNFTVNVSDYYPTANDYGYLYDITMSRTFGDELKQISFDMSNEPVIPRGYFLTKDFGHLV
jgi:hypothetical protein